MRYIKDFIKRKRLIIGLFGVALIIPFLYQVTANIPDIYPPWGEFVFSSGVKLSYSYMASFIFYILVTYIPGHRDKQRAYRYVKFHIEVIINIHYAIIDKLIEAGRTFENLIGEETNNINRENMTEENFIYLCQFIGPSMPSGSFLGYNEVQHNQEANWSEYLSFNIEISEREIDKILRNVVHMDLELLQIIHELESCSFFRMKQMILDMSHDTGLGFSTISTPLSAYHKIIVQLKNYDQNSIIATS